MKRDLYLPSSSSRTAISKYTSSTHSAGSNFTCQLCLPTFRELLHLPTSSANFSRVASPANFACQLVESCFTCQLCQRFRELLHLPTSCQLFEHYFTCQLLMPTFREVLHLPTSHANLSRIASPTNFSSILIPTFRELLHQLLMPTFRELLHLQTSHANFKSRLFEYNCSTGSLFPLLRLQNRNFQGYIARGAYSRKNVTFKYNCSTRSASAAQAEHLVHRYKR